MKKVCDITHVVVPGTYDPITFGHLDVIRRANRFCPCVTVGIAASLTKHGQGPVFSLEQRVDLVHKVLLGEGLADEIEVRPFSGLLIDFCHEVGARAVVKGLRAATDFEYELQQADLNAKLSPDIESIFVISSQEFGYVSSSLVREVAKHGGDVSMLVPSVVASALKKVFV